MVTCRGRAGGVRVVVVREQKDPFVTVLGTTAGDRYMVHTYNHVVYPRD